MHGRPRIAVRAGDQSPFPLENLVALNIRGPGKSVDLDLGDGLNRKTAGAKALAAFFQDLADQLVREDKPASALGK